MVKDPKFIPNLEEYISKVRPEASYFFEADGNRVCAFVLNIDSVDMIPAIVEPLFQDMVANVELHPVMSFDDLKKAIQHMTT
ncbi:MAG TPA: hypothetical protein VF884_08340 [Nitrososphaeraceae archaeon]